LFIDSALSYGGYSAAAIKAVNARLLKIVASGFTYFATVGTVNIGYNATHGEEDRPFFYGADVPDLVTSIGFGIGVSFPLWYIGSGQNYQIWSASFVVYFR
jgi:hypothetical protein